VADEPVDELVEDALRRSFLGGLPRELLGELIAGGQRTDYPAGSTIYREGSAPGAEVVVRGLVRVFMSFPEGRQVTVRYAREADVLGIPVIVGGLPASAFTTCATAGPPRLFGRACTQASYRRSCATATPHDRRNLHARDAHPERASGPGSLRPIRASEPRMTTWPP
jgi:hypothetical protein